MNTPSLVVRMLLLDLCVRKVPWLRYDLSVYEIMCERKCSATLVRGGERDATRNDATRHQCHFMFRLFDTPRCAGRHLLATLSSYTTRYQILRYDVRLKTRASNGAVHSRRGRAERFTDAGSKQSVTDRNRSCIAICSA